jgi:hypothetical protein
MRKTIMTALIAAGLLASASAQTTQAERPSDSLDRPFTADGRIRMDLGAGEYRITGNQDNRIRLDWSVRNPDDLRKVKARADVQGRDAVISTEGPRNGFKVAIRVPSRADLYVRLTAGELSIESIEGNKDVELHAGEMRIDVGRPEDYSRVDASVWVGELHASPYHAQKEGLFRSFDWNGKGPYRLHAALKAGELRLYSKAAPQAER